MPTATFRVLFRFLVLAHDRRRVLHFNVTANPSAEWTARQLVQAFPEERAPRFLLRDRDQIYGARFSRVVEVLGVEQVVTAARSPWQNAYAERLIGSLRRECLDHIVVLGEVHLLRILAEYFDYYNRARCHLSLAGDAPEARPAQGPELGRVVELPEVGGLHHRYERGVMPWCSRMALAKALCSRARMGTASRTVSGTPLPSEGALLPADGVLHRRSRPITILPVTPHC